MAQTVAAELFIGADNETGVCDRDRITTLVAKNHQGFTVREALGYWQGHREDTLCVLISDTRDAIVDTARLLKSELAQDAIGVQWLPALSFI